MSAQVASSYICLAPHYPGIPLLGLGLHLLSRHPPEPAEEFPSAMELPFEKNSYM